MNMHDNDMDALFRSKLDGFEVEPSARVWANINQELHGTSNRRKKFVPLLRIAASVAVLIAAGLFFLPRGKKVYQLQPKNRLAKTTVVKPFVPAPPTNITQPVHIASRLQPAAGSQKGQQLAAVRQAKVHPVTVTTIQKQPVVAPDQTDALATANNRQALMAAVQTKVTVNKPVVPDTQVIPKLIDADADTKPVTVLASANPTAEEDTKAIPVKKRKAHGFGGILNAMIGVVDKRQDKIIEFTDTDEGDSVTGINLGIVKIKKQK